MKLIVYAILSPLLRDICNSLIADKEIELCVVLTDHKLAKLGNFLDLPMCSFEEGIKKYPPSEYKMLVIGLVHPRTNKEMYERAKAKGYSFISFIEGGTKIHDKVQIGSNNIIFRSYIGAFVKLGNNNIVCPNTFIGHNTVVQDHNYIAPGCTICGHCKLKDLSFIGAGSTIINAITIEEENLIGAGSVIQRNTDKFSKYVMLSARKVGEHRETGVSMKDLSRVVGSPEKVEEVS